MPGLGDVAPFARKLDGLGAEYMITGATAAIAYGQPRTTNDVDIVVALEKRHLPGLAAAFPDSEYYLPPESVIQVEQARERRGHFNIFHMSSGFKADIYLTGSDPLHAWAMPLRRRIEWPGLGAFYVAPPEYVILRKLEYFREGGSEKHSRDIENILAITPVDRTAIDTWAARMGLTETWRRFRAS